MMRKTQACTVTLLGFLGALYVAPGASANTFAVASTGIDSAGNALPAGTADPDYSLASSPTGPGAAFVVITGPGNPIKPFGPWIVDSSSSEWIAPAADQSHFTTQGVFDYRTTFSLAGLIPSTALIEGLWSSDNSAVIDLNGESTGITLPVEPFRSLNAFSIASGFISGINTLDFIVTNTPGGSAIADATGLNVEITRTFAELINPVPEPSSWILMSVGVISLTLFRRRAYRSQN